MNEITSEYFYDSPLAIDQPLSLTDKELRDAAGIMTKLPSTRSVIPAGYTYLGQFIDHDISLDLSRIPFTQIAATRGRFRNGRTPFFDLETLYGSEIADPVTGVTRRDLMADDVNLRLGPTVSVTGLPDVFDNDLYRTPDGTPVAIDARNDENLIISQLQVAFIKFHNSIVRKFGLSGNDGFERARRLVIQHYQWVVLEDFIPKIVKCDVLAEARNGVRMFYPGSLDESIMPLEFSVGAYRFGHSMIRNVYNWNDRITDDSIGSLTSINRLMRLNGRFRFDVHGTRSLPNEWLINWRWFFDIDGSKHREPARFNYAHAIDPSISSRLDSFAFDVAGGPGGELSLSALDLFRSRAVGLASGQAIAKRITNDETSVLNPDVIGHFTQLSGRILNETPLWLYLLVEAASDSGGAKLGAVGSRIVAETFLELIARSEFSILGRDFKSDPDFLGTDGRFGMAELLTYADLNGDLIDPVGQAMKKRARAD